MYFVDLLKTCCLSENLAQGRTKPPEVQVSRLRNSKPVRLLPWLVNVVPIALIQIMDYVTDLIVVINLYNNDGLTFSGAWKVGFSGILFSLLAAWYNLIFYARGTASLTTKQIIITCLLAPFNLHILGIGIIFALRADAGGGTKADMVYSESFLWLKQNESIFEGVPMALITIGAVFTTVDIDLDKQMMLCSSLILSLFSISYGIFGLTAHIFEEHIVSRRMQLFACMTVHEVYTMMTIGICFTSPTNPALGIIISIMLLLISCGWMGLDHFTYECDWFEKTFAVLIFFALTFGTCIIDKPFWYGVGNYPLWNFRIFPIARRALLAAASIRIISTDPRKDIAYMVLILGFMDIFASTRMFRLIGLAEWDTFCIFVCREKKKEINAAPSPTFPPVNKNIELAIKFGYLWQYDVLEFIIWKSSCKKEVPQKMWEVESYCRALIQRMDKLSQDERKAIRWALESYVPSDDGNGSAEVNLLCLLRLGPIPWSGSDDVLPHPMRAMPLGNAFQISLWKTKPCFFGENPKHTAYELSENCKRCDWFISHAWTDPGERKLRMLQEYLCLQDLLGIWMITFLFLAVFSLPVGFAIQSEFKSFPGWALSIVIVIVMLLFLLWVCLSTKNIIPPKFAPWSFSRQTVWLDKCCIDQRTPERVKAGVYSFKRFLDNCNGMVAFVSSTYFTRIWCVYELASFCKMLESDMERQLLLFSLDWPSSIIQCKSSKVSKDESAYFKEFKCRNAKCYKPADRAWVLEKIRNEWGSEQAFDKYVRNTLPSIFAESKEIYREQLKTVANRSLERLFGG